MPKSSAERGRLYRDRHPDYAKGRGEYFRKYRTGIAVKTKHPRRFIGIDGEGGGTDDLGRQNYRLMCASDRHGRFKRELFLNNERLTTRHCFEFILSMPADAYLSGYFFNYDVTMILRDLPAGRLQRALSRESRYTFWEDYAFEWIPKQYLRVARAVDRDTFKIIPGTSRTVDEAGGFYQKSFVEALKSFEIADDVTLERIGTGKEGRDTFDLMTDEIRQYCMAECQMLAKLQHKFRETCYKVDIYPSAWRGAGWVAAALHNQHETPRRAKPERHASYPELPERDPHLETLADYAYYGGRFEVTQIGMIAGPVYYYDLNSAYPAAMIGLPCPLHTKWKRFLGKPTQSLYLAEISYEHIAQNLCGLPHRRKGRLYWPRAGRGAYFSVEIEAAIEAGASIIWRGGYEAHINCECRPFQWVQTLFEYRRSIGKSLVGYPIKLGLNALYGKLCQRIGGAPFRDILSAGLITATTRARLIRAYMPSPDDCLMLATDGLFSRVKLPHLVIGPGLGEWEGQERPTGLFICQPGLYWSPGSDQLPKTRGIPRSQIIKYRDTFERLFTHWATGAGTDEFPSFTVPVKNFIGHKLANSWGKPEAAGCWRQMPREISFDWSQKRRVDGIAFRAGYAQTYPHDGSIFAKSEAFDPDILTELQEQELMDMARPDYEPWGNTGE